MNHWRIVATIMTLAVLVLAAPSLVQANSLPLPNQPLEPMGTAFTYQGYLTDGGAPAEGVYDFEFSLYDAATGGNLADTVPLADVTVTGGYFTVLLDFGPEPASGEAHWLSIAVRPGAETGAFTTLEPRQALTAVPYATSAGSSPWTGLLGIPAGFADGVDNDTTYTAGHSLTLSGTEFSVNFGGTGTAETASHSDHIHLNYWGTTGNDHTSSATNFIGTTDNVALVFRVNDLRALRLEPNATSPNIIGGYSGNSVTAGIYGATIGGGGFSGDVNQVTGNYGTVGGGANNIASGEYAIVGGGGGNTASGLGATLGGGGINLTSGEYATLGGGVLNYAAGDYATLGGGEENNASGTHSTVGGGYSNAADGVDATVGGGYNNIASLYYATVGGGYSNDADGTAATVGGGSGNDADGEYAAVGGGAGNTASGDYSTVPGGASAEAWQYGQMAYASGSFMYDGDAQASLYVLRNASTGTVWTNLYLDPTNSVLLTIATDQVMTFDILIVGSTDAGESAGYRIQGVIENIGGATALVGTPSVTVLGENDTAWNVQVLADDTNDALLIQVMGNSETIRWVASVQTAEVTFP